MEYALSPTTSFASDDMRRDPLSERLYAAKTAIGRTVTGLLFALATGQAAGATGPQAADLVFTNGIVYTVDAHDTVAGALAVRDGRIAWIGDSQGAAAWIGAGTRTVDLQGRMLLPGLVDAHMHPQSGGLRMLMCNLEYARLTLAAFRARIQACLDADTQAGPDAWLEVINWFQQDMEPRGLELTHADLDALRTTRPVLVRSSFGHSTLVNARGLRLANITRATPDPKDGRITRDARGDATGLLEDGAQALARDLVPPPSAATHLLAARKALAAMAAQGITTMLDAYTDPETLTAWAALQQAGELTLRANFGVLIDADGGLDAVAAIARERAHWDQGPPRPQPTLRLRTAKLFLDGVIAGPAHTGAMVAPYFENQGSHEHPRWRPGGNRGPTPYFSAAELDALLVELVRAGIDPHVHADGDGAVRLALDAFAARHSEIARAGLRPAIAHAELVDPADFARFAELGVMPVLSFQWGKPAPDTVDGLRDALGPYRHAIVEPSGLLALYGARLAFGSDWPVDPLAPWLALQVALTRAAVDTHDAARYPGRLGIDPGLDLAVALRAMTLDAAYTLHLEKDTGSLEPGKFADLIVLDRNLLTTPAHDIATTRVLLTMTGGRIVHEQPAPPP